MSDREKRLLYILGIAAFVLLNVFGFKFLVGLRRGYDLDLKDAQRGLDRAHEYEENARKVASEMEWLAKNEPKPRQGQTVQTELEQYASNQAQSAQLIVKTRKILPSDTSGSYYHAEQIEFTVTGTEASLYRWLHQLQQPEQFRSVVKLRLSPQREDDTKIDCVATISQWYVPGDVNEDAGNPADAEQKPATE
jgi:hypothetical protein